MAGLAAFVIANGLLFAIGFPIALLIMLAWLIFSGSSAFTTRGAWHKHYIEQEYWLEWIRMGYGGEMPKHWKPANWKEIRERAIKEAEENAREYGVKL